MRIAVIGAGAMGALYGGYLSRENDVLLVDTNPAQVEAINRGLLIHEPDGTKHTVYPKAVCSAQGEAPVDLIVLFVKAMFSRDGGETWDVGHDVYVNGVNLDLGYPSSIELEDGSILTVFYAHSEPSKPATVMQCRWSFA